MAKYVVRPELLDALMLAESGGNNNAVSPKGARGAFQIMPKTARDPGFGIMPLRDNSPEEQRRFATDYLGAMLDKFGGDEAMAVAAYNAGPGAVEKHGDIPPFRETQGYVAKIGRLLNPISSAQAEEAPQVTAESPMQYPDTDPDVIRFNELRAKAQANQVDPDVARFNELRAKASAKTEQPKEPDTGYALPNFLSGLGSSVLNQAGALAQIPSAALKKLGVMDQQSAYDNVPEWLLSEAQKGKQDAPGFAGGAGKFVGDVLPFLATPTAAFQPGLVGKIVPTIKNVLAQGGLATSLTPGSGRDRAAAGAGAGLGAAVFPAVTGGISSLIKGFDPSDAGKALQDLGVVPTVGQGINKDGILGQIVSAFEKYNTSSPFLGQVISSAENRAAKEGLRAIYNKNVAVPIQSIKTGPLTRTFGVEPKGESMQSILDDTYGQLTKSYDALYKGNKIRAANLQSFTHNVIDNNRYGLSADEMTKLKAIVNNLFENKVDKKGIMDANQMKFIISDIRNEANTYKSKLNSIAERNMGKALDDVNDFITNYSNTYLPKSVSDGVKQIDKSYGSYKIFEDAASSARAAKNEGEITPSEIMRAIRSFDVKRGKKSQFARGQSHMQTDAKNLSQLFGELMPDSGTPPRMQWGDLANPMFYLRGAASIPMYIGSTRPAQKYMLGGYDFQRPTSLFIDKYITPRMAPGAAGLGYYLYDQSR